MPMLTTSVIGLAGRPLGAAGTNGVGERLHRIEHGVDVVLNVLPVELDAGLPSRLRSAVCSTARSSVMLMRLPENIALRLSPRPAASASFSSSSIVFRVTAHFDQSSRRSPSRSENSRKRPGSSAKALRMLFGASARSLRNAVSAEATDLAATTDLQRMRFSAHSIAQRWRLQEPNRSRERQVEILARVIGRRGSISGVNGTDQNNSLAQRVGPTIPSRCPQGIDRAPRGDVMPQRNDTAIWSGLFRISAESGQTLQAQIRQAIVAAILDRQIAASMPLPSCRILAEKLGVARGTVVLAFQQLVDQGFLIARERRGHFVNPDVIASPPRPLQKVDQPSIRSTGRRCVSWTPTEIAAPPLQNANWIKSPYPFVYGQFDPSAVPDA
jgi:DNA-binding transcriptional regulator YhcF (GntR family)